MSQVHLELGTKKASKKREKDVTDTGLQYLKEKKPEKRDVLFLLSQLMQMQIHINPHNRRSSQTREFEIMYHRSERN